MTKIVHFEIPADDPQRASAFYRDALGWEITRYGDQPYWLVRAGEDDEPGANGALVTREDLHRSPVLIAGQHHRPVPAGQTRGHGPGLSRPYLQALPVLGFAPGNG